MALIENKEQIQEFAIVAKDRIAQVGKAWWWSLVIVFVACFPLFFILRASFTSALVASHTFPAFIYQVEEKQPLEITDKKIFRLTPGSYSGYIKIKNSANLNWGVVSQPYTAIFKTLGGTEVTRVTGSTYILPGSEKIIVFARFKADREPTELEVTLGPANFTHKPERADANLKLSRVELETRGSELFVSAAITNNTAFTISRVDLPVILYDRENKIVGVNYTNVNDVKQQETRTFQFAWPSVPTGASRAEILPQVNLFDPTIYQLPAGQSQF